MGRFETILVDIDDRGVATITLNRPEKKNALSGQMISELTIVASDIPKNEEIRVAVLRGAGDTFCAGGDLAWMRQQISADRQERIHEARKLANMLRSLNEMPIPLLGAIHGGAFGGGVGLACVCDLAIAEKKSKFGFMETRLGLIPATISPYVIARMGEGSARRVFMSARVFSAAEAVALNIIADNVNMTELYDRIEEEISPYLAVAPKAVGSSKTLARMLGPRIDDAVIEKTINLLCDTWEGKEAREGIEAFLSKRKPYWS